MLFEKGFWGFPGCWSPGMGRCRHPRFGQVAMRLRVVKTYTSSHVQSKPSNKLLHSLNPSFAIFTYPELQVKKGASQPSLVVHTFHHLHQKRSKLDLFPSQPPKPALKHFDLLLLPNPSLSWWC